MKHTFKVTMILVMIFFLSQIIGLVIVNQYINIEETSETGITTVREGAYNRTGIAPPEFQPEEEKFMWIVIIIAILIGTGLVLLIIKFKKLKLWIFWFMLSIMICLYVAISQFIYMLLTWLGLPADFQLLDSYASGVILSSVSFLVFIFGLTLYITSKKKQKNIAVTIMMVGFAGFFLTNAGIPFTVTSLVTLGVAGLLTYIKLVKKNIYVHNITEIFLYGGLAALIVPGVAEIAAIMLLIAISVYDMIAVWKTKHMVTMAKFQTESKLFAGLMMPYDNQTGKIVTHTPSVPKNAKPLPPKSKDRGVKTAILGGGDIAFPLIFAGTVMKTTNSFLYPTIIALTSTIALMFLLIYSTKGKFYPAMPFISAGSFTGYGIVLILQYAI